MNEGLCVWLTGLPCSGKTTLGRMLVQFLANAVLLDGDEVRQQLSKDMGFSREDRDENVRRIAWVAGKIVSVGGIAVVAVVSPYGQARKDARRSIHKFVEVYVCCPVEVCMLRDEKGMYHKAVQGKISSFTGVNDPYEEPTNPDVIVYTDRETAQESLSKVLEKLERMSCVNSLKSSV